MSELRDFIADRQRLEVIELYLPLGSRILEEMAHPSESGKLVTNFREFVEGHNESLSGLADALRRCAQSSDALHSSQESLRSVQEDLEYVRSPEYMTSLRIDLQAKLDAITDPEERRKFLVRELASLEGRIAERERRTTEMKSRDTELFGEKKTAEDTLKAVHDEKLRAAKGVEMAEHSLYKKCLRDGETEERALKIATMDHLPRIFQIYDLLTVVYRISTEEEATKRGAKMRYLLNVKSDGTSES